MKESAELKRLKRVILADNLRIPNGMTDMLKNDLIALLDGYFDLQKESVHLDLSVSEDGAYKIEWKATANALKTFRSVQ